jgi:hypothetical protein
VPRRAVLVPEVDLAATVPDQSAALAAEDAPAPMAAVYVPTLAAGRGWAILMQIPYGREDDDRYRPQSDRAFRSLSQHATRYLMYAERRPEDLARL